MKTKVYPFHIDAGHGWLEVPTKELEALGLAGKVSACSYRSRDGMTVYLEEDCDATMFADAIGSNFTHRRVDDGDNSPIRDLPSFRA